MKRKLPPGYYVEKRLEMPRYALYRSLSTKEAKGVPLLTRRLREFVTTTSTLWGARRVAERHNRFIEQYGRVPALVESGGD